MKPRLALLSALVLALLLVLVLQPTAAGPAPNPSPAPQLAPVPGAIEALVTVGNRPRALAPNRFGAFNRFALAAGTRVPIELQLPGALENDRVAVGTMDGGRILVGSGVGAIAAPTTQHVVGPGNRVRFTFEAGSQQGVYRVLARRGRIARVFEFWVGPPLPANTRGTLGN